MTINIINEVKVPFSFHYKKLAEQIITAAMDYEAFPYEAEVNLTLVEWELIIKIVIKFKQRCRALGGEKTQHKQVLG